MPSINSSGVQITGGSKPACRQANSILGRVTDPHQRRVRPGHAGERHVPFPDLQLLSVLAAARVSSVCIVDSSGSMQPTAAQSARS